MRRDRPGSRTIRLVPAKPAVRSSVERCVAALYLCAGVGVDFAVQADLFKRRCGPFHSSSLLCGLPYCTSAGIDFFGTPTMGWMASMVVQVPTMSLRSLIPEIPV